MSTNVSLTSETEEYANRLVANGLFNSVNEVVKDALRLHSQQEKIYLKELHQELKLATDQIDRGETQPHNMQEIIDEVDTQRAEND